MFTHYIYIPEGGFFIAQAPLIFFICYVYDISCQIIIDRVLDKKQRFEY